MIECSDKLFESNGILYAVDKTVVSYPEKANDDCFRFEDESWWFQNRNKLIISVVKQFTSGQLFLDIGGGNGYVAKGLQDAGETVVLVEPGHQGAINAQKRGLKQIICSSIEDVGIKENTIEAVGLFDVIEHIEDVQTFLNHINRLMRPGGHVFITVPAYQLLWSIDDDYAGHYRRYTLKSLERVMQSSGFEKVRHTYFFSFLVLPILFSRTIAQRLLKKKAVKVGSAEKAAKEHINKGLGGKFIAAICSFERRLITGGMQIPMGASCLGAFRKKATNFLL